MMFNSNEHEVCLTAPRYKVQLEGFPGVTQIDVI